MSLKLGREKESSLLASLVYRLRLLPLSKKTKLKLFLDFEWIFDRLAHEISYEYYSPDEHPMRQQSVDYILGFLKPEYTVLDLGCSRGEITLRLAERTKKVVGVDHSEEAITVARSQAKQNTHFHVGDAEAFLLASEENFDVLILSHILEHLDDPEGLLKQYKNYFRFIYVEVPDLDKTIFNKMRSELGSSLVYTDADHVWEFDRDTVVHMLEDCGLVILSQDFRSGVQRYWCETGK